MKLLTKAIETKLRSNHSENQATWGSVDHVPVVKFFGGSSCTWLITEMDPDGDTLFGLCDLGHGFAELGYVSLRELTAIRFKPFGLPVERDRWFKGCKPISEYAAEARENGRIAA